MVAVAQLVESRIVIPVVVGSSPISHPKYSNTCATFLRDIARNIFPFLRFGSTEATLRRPGKMRVLL
jgi:hypothetical protein